MLAALFAQSSDYRINGKIEDNQKKALEGATISLMRSTDSSVVKIAVADKEGNFELDRLAAQEYFLQVSAVGFASYNSEKLKPGADQPVITVATIALSPEASSMGSVTVVAKRPLIEMKADRTLVNVDAAVTNVGATALEVLEKSPGVTVDKDGNVSLRGKQGVLVLIDGRPTYLSGADLASMLKGMSANQLDQIEIMTNPPAKYDAAGNSGVINIKTKKNKQKGFNGNVSLSYGQGIYWKTNNSLNLNYRNSKFNVFLNYSQNANKGFSDLHILRTYYGEDNKTVTAVFEQPTNMIGHGRNNTLKLGMDYFLSKKTTIGIVTSGFINKGNFDATSTGYLKNAQSQTDSIANTISMNRDKWKNGSVNLNFRQQINTSDELTADADFIQYRSDNTQLFNNHIYYPDNTTASRDQLQGVLPSDIRILSFKSDYTKNFKSGYKLEAGIKSSYVKTDNEAVYSVLNGSQWEVDYEKTNHFLYEENINAAYINGNKQFKKWTLQAGLRFENTNYNGDQLGNQQKPDSSFRRNYNSLFPTVFISYAADSNNTFTINTGRRIDRPAYQQLNPFLFFINKFTYVVGNPFLQPQYTYNVELSHSYKGKLTTGLNYSKTSGYSSQVFKPVGEITVLSEDNLGSAENFGVSLGTQLNPAKWWNLSVNVNVNYRKVKGFAFDQPVKTEAANGQVNVNNQFNFNKGWSAELSGFYNSKNVDGQFTIQPFGQVAAGVSKQVFKGKGSVKLSARDIFRTIIIDGQIDYGNVVEHFIQSHESRVVNVAFTYRFGKQMKETGRRNTGGASEEQNRVRAGN